MISSPLTALSPGYLFCGTDGTCGGSDARCLTGNYDCLSQSCSDPTGATTNGTCAPPPSFGVPDDFGCSNSTNCASRYCDTGDFLCSSVAASGGGGLTGPSQRARVKARSLEGHNPKDKRKGKLHNFFRKQSCPQGQTVCGTGRGYEVTNSLFEMKK